MLLRHLAQTSRAVAAEPGRRAKITLLADCLRALGPAEAPAAVALLSGESHRLRTGVGPAALRDLPPPAAEPSLGVREAERLLEAIAEVHGTGAQAGRRRLLAGLFERATGVEQAFLRAVLVGELRQGALDAVVADAVARAAGVPAAAVRRALMFRGSARAVAEAALTGGAPALDAFRLEVGRPVRPMLAASTPDVGSALDRIGPAALEWKLDGIRVQVHRDGQDVAVFTRSLDDITARVPEVTEAALALPVRSAVLDGEAIALGPDGRPRPFQETAARTATRRDPERLRAEVPLSAYFFDLLHRDGEDLVDRPGRERWAALAGSAPAGLRVAHTETGDRDQALAFFREALALGHEGVLAKDPAAGYAAGRRGAGWIKVKPRHTLDLVVLAAEWGSGRRRGFLSNLHLGARAAGEPGLGPWVMLGKTFKGLTDETLAWQTTELLAREVERDAYTVRVRPELVVEIAFDGVQRSPRYPAGLALRFARVVRYRPDKNAADADTVATVRECAASREFS
ncbi:ATP-dependent DNA ligase [Streptomyces sp. CB01881]|uniref:ATP-dependent DNA ligase n=1 Tax=Streptomyces sp. CB01881 TaxID=2078691 RepID=UPI000CDBDF0F|nr:ATP-dependent DNA ligase [Streptomyces sp. CB01881]AUY53360.1 ATP-dependent DNA ligase [Streptomyces sp. CB01881]TYC69512.1 ATP-dependent DNA ligase [Streptomyces sp. CB01881]